MSPEHATGAPVAGPIHVDRADAGYYDLLGGRLYSAVVSDILDGLGRPGQVLASGLAPVVPGDWTLAGRIRTARAVAVDAQPERPYELLLRIIDDLRAGDMLLIDAGGRVASGIFGGLLATAIDAAGGRGAIIEGGVRDVGELGRMGFPTIARGVCPADSKGREEVVAIDEPVVCGGVEIASGDLVIADADGTVIVPAEIEQEVVRLALEKVSGENHVRRELANGMKASEAFARYGIL